jgi:ribose 5-phosphate isomerase B
MGEQRENEELQALVRAVGREQAGGPIVPDPLAEAESVVDESVRTVITEAEVRRVPVGGRLLVREGVVVTPLASDLLASRQVELRYRTARHSAAGRLVIAIGADHGGFEAKAGISTLLAELGCQYRDFGTLTPEPVDYPDIAHAVARSVADGVSDLGILIDGAGIGSCMAANKVPGIRAALGYDEASARNSREHNYANVLTLGAGLQPLETLLGIVRTWLATPYGEARHGKRVAKITAIERQYLR